MISVVLFDAGNTLVELDYGALSMIFTTEGVPAGPERLRATADGLRPAIDSFLATRDRSTEGPGTRAFFLAGVFAALGVTDDALRERLADRLSRELSALWRCRIPGSHETLKALRAAGYRLGVVSNSDGSVARGVEEWGLSGLFETVVDSGVVGVEKPDPRIFAIALEGMGVEPSSALHVGDLPAVDVAGARAAGLSAVLVDPGDLFPDAGVPRIRSLPELLPLLGAQAGGPPQLR